MFDLHVASLISEGHVHLHGQIQLVRVTGQFGRPKRRSNASWLQHTPSAASWRNEWVRLLP